MDKQALRRDMLSLRENISAGERKAKAARACGYLFASALWKNAARIAIFVSLPNEFSTSAIIERGWKEGKLVSVPKILDFQNRMMAFWPVKAWSDLRPGCKGIMEPANGAPVQFSKTDLMLLPGLAFDKKGWRLGYGGGFYDAFLAALPKKPNLLGLCFSEQIIGAVPHDSCDIPVGGLCSDAGMDWVSHDTF